MLNFIDATLLYKKRNRIVLSMKGGVAYFCLCSKYVNTNVVCYTDRPPK